jgi:hypothetical protein
MASDSNVALPKTECRSPASDDKTAEAKSDEVLSLFKKNKTTKENVAVDKVDLIVNKQKTPVVLDCNKCTMLKDKEKHYVENVGVCSNGVMIVRIKEQIEKIKTTRQKSEDNAARRETTEDVVRRRKTTCQ